MMNRVLAFLLICMGYVALAQNQPKFEIGDTLPNFFFKGNFKKPYYLADLKGSYVMIIFWASWNPKSRELQQEMVAPYLKFKDKKFKKGRKFYMISVSIDDSKKLWELALKKDNIPWTYHSCDQMVWKSALVESCRVFTIPFNYLLNSEGIIVAKNINGQDLERLLYGY